MFIMRAGFNGSGRQLNHRISLRCGFCSFPSPSGDVIGQSRDPRRRQHPQLNNDEDDDDDEEDDDGDEDDEEYGDSKRMRRAAPEMASLGRHRSYSPQHLRVRRSLRPYSI